MSLIQRAASHWDGKLQHYALTLFWGLAVINFVWIFIPVMFKQADFTEILGELVSFTLTTGFFLALLTYSRKWATAIVESFQQAGATASGFSGKLKPIDVFDTALSLSNTMSLAGAGSWDPFVNISVALATAFVLIGFTFIAAFMCLAIIESYVVINASVLFMGFGGSQWTREYSISIARYGVAVGAKLFVLTLLVGLINQSAREWTAAYQQDNASMWTLVGLAIVCAYLCKTIPDLIQGVINGTSMGGGHHLGEMATVAATAATAAASGVALGNAMSGAAGGGGGPAGSAISSSLGDSLNSSFAGGGGGAGSSMGFGSGSGTESGTPLYPDAPVAPKQKPSAFEAEMKRYQERVQAARNGGSNETYGSNSGRSTGSAADSAGSASASTNQTEKQSGSSSRDAVNAALKGVGTLAALTVPGMAAAGSLSLGPDVAAASGGSSGPKLADMSREEGTMEVDTSSAPNTIRAASSSDLSEIVPSEAAPLSAHFQPHHAQVSDTVTPVQGNSTEEVENGV